MNTTTATIEWVREPHNRWSHCSAGCGRSGRWLLYIMGHRAGRQVCDRCRHDMQTAWDSATPTTDVVKVAA